MILSEQRPLMDNLKPKLDSDEEDSILLRNKTRRQASPTRIVDAVLENENDDDDERLARRKSRLLEPHPASANSPCASGSTAKRKDAAAPRGISQAQIGEHYGNCIRLAAENKITPKNAFNLHLIDYMSEMLKKEDYASFQIASSSLDAGAKIYAGRVDAVHQETYQVLTGLGRSDKPQVTGDDDDAENADNGDDLSGQTGGVGSGRPDTRKKTQIHREILQKQLSKIRSKVLAAKADVDPLFQHQTATYDEGGTAELRLNQLSTLDEACVLILDSSTRIMQTPSQPTSNTVNIVGLVDFLFPLHPKNSSQLTMCPSLQNFRFTGWDKSQDWESSTVRPSEVKATSPVSALGDSKMHMDNDDDDDDHVDDYPQQGMDDDDNDRTLTEQAFTDLDKIIPCGSSNAAAATEFNENQAVISVENGRAVPPSSPIHTTGTDGELFVSSLKTMLDKQYEHFGQLNDHLLGMWAGPEHWRKKAKRRRFDPVTGQEEDVDLNAREENEYAETEVVTTTVGKSRKSSRAKKGKPAKVMYLEALAQGENKTRNGHLTRREWPKGTLSEGIPNTAAANATVFKEQYRQKAGRQVNLLPSELSDSRQTLYRLFNRKVILESPQSGGPTSDGPPKLNAPQVDRLGVGPNANSELCPVIDWSNGPIGMDPDRAVDLMEDHVIDDMDDAPDLQICIHDDDDDDIALPFERAFTQATTAGFVDYGMHGELELISQPRKVARVEIGYARTAKMINVRRLKSAMWAFLEHSIPNAAAGVVASATPRSPYSAASTSSAPEPPASLAGDTDPVMDLPDPPVLIDQTDEHAPTDKASEPQIPGARSFSELIDSLPNRISWQMAKELSISIALNCLLHLSNEKQLYLECSDRLSDIFISQGLPQFELEKLSSYASDAAYDETDPDAPSKRPTRPDGGRQTKAKRFRPSTLDSWLDDNGRESQNSAG